LLSVAVLFGVYHQPIMRLYQVLSMFNKDKIVHNFRNSHTLGFPHRTMSTRKFKEAVLEPHSSASTPTLPTHFEWNGTVIPLQQHLDEHWSTGLVVVKADSTTSSRLLYEDYYRGHDQSTRCISWSMGKSIVSAAFGIAVEEGLIGDIREKKVTDYVSSLVGSGYDDVRLIDVLQMSSGVAFNEDYFDPLSDINVMGYTLALGWSMESFVKRLKGQDTPGTKRHYVSMDTQVLGMVLREVVRPLKHTVSSYVEDRLWSKVGFQQDATWLMDNENDQMELAFGTISATTRDFARFGLLYLNEGKSPASGEQVVPKDWVRASTTASLPHLLPGNPELADISMFGYGYQWWLGAKPDDPKSLSGEFLAIGVYNQLIYVSPEDKTVIALNSANPFFEDQMIVSESQAVAMFRAITTAFKDL